MRTVLLVLVVVGTLVTVAVATRGKSCHYNTHLVPPISCTDEE